MLEHEDDYFDCVYSIIATPYEMMVPLDDAGIDFSQIGDWELFLLMFMGLREKDTSLVFGDLDLKKFQFAENENTKMTILTDPESGAIIDKTVYKTICGHLRRMLDIPKEDKKPGNEEAKRYMLEKARKRAKRQKKKQRPSQLEGVIISLVNTAEFPYNYETVKELTIYQLYKSLKQVSHKIHFDNTMIGCYAGTVKTSDLKQSDLTWLNTT